MNRSFLISILLSLLIALSIKAEKHDQIMENTLPPPADFIKQPFDVIRYEAELDLTKAPDRDMSGICSLEVYWRGDPDTSKFFFHLRGLQVDSVLYDDQKTEARVIGDPDDNDYHYEVSTFPGKPGDKVIIKVFYHGEMTPEHITSKYKWGGVHSDVNLLYSLGVGILCNYVSTTQHWLPCYDHPSDKAEFQASFKVPKDMNVASIGTVEIEESEQYNTYIWTHDHPCATYLYTFAIGYLHELNFYGADVPVVVYSIEQDTTICRFHFERVPKMVNYYASLFGEYPFEKVGYVLAPKGSMEHETMITMHQGLVRHEYYAEDTLTTTTAHELSHMWFGDMVTCRDFSEAWLNEGFATYCEALWLEHLVGRDAYLTALDTEIGSYIEMIAESEGVFPLHDFYREPPSSNYPGTIYSKGAAVLGMLRTLVAKSKGDDQFFAAIRHYLNKHKYGTATTEDLKNDLEEYLQLNLDFFFDQWIYGKGWPKIRVQADKIYDKEQDELTADVFVQQIQSDDLGFYEMLPISFKFVDDQGNISEHTRIMYQGTEFYTFEDVPEFTEIIINQGDFRTLLEVEEVNIVGVHEIRNTDFNIFPNPAGNDVNISLTGIYGDIHLSLSDLLGRIIIEKDIYNANGNISKNINLENINPGVYYLELKGKNYKKSKILRIIK